MSGLVSDVSAGGAWIYCWNTPPEGERVTFTVRPDARAEPVEFHGQVVRAMPDGDGVSIPGFAVRWTQARSSGSRSFVRRFLSRLFGIDTLVWRRGDGHAAWSPGVSPAEAALQQDPSVLPGPVGAPKRETTVASSYRTDEESSMRFRYQPPPVSPGEMPQWATPLPTDGGHGSLPCTPPPIPEDARRDDAPERQETEGADIIHLVPNIGAERRDMVRMGADAGVHLRVGETMLFGRVTDINHQGAWIATGERRLPRIGDIMAFIYPLAPWSDHDIRLVGQVTRTSLGTSSGFAVELVQVDERGQPGAFERHLNLLTPLD